MPIVDSLLPIIRNLVKVDDAEFQDSAIKDFLDLSRMEHNPTLSWSDLSQTTNEKHRFPIVLLTCRDILLSRAADAAKEASKSAQSFSTDGHFRTDPNTKLSEAFERRYNKLVSDLNLDRGVREQIETGVLTTFDTVLHKTVPGGMQEDPPVVTITGKTDSSDCLLFWDKIPIADFKRYRVYRHTASGIEDRTRDTEGASHPGVIAAATHVEDIEEQWRIAYRDESLSSGSYFYVVVVQDHNERVSFSNEVKLTVT